MFYYLCFVCTYVCVSRLLHSTRGLCYLVSREKQGEREFDEVETF